MASAFDGSRAILINNSTQRIFRLILIKYVYFLHICKASIRGSNYTKILLANIYLNELDEEEMIQRVVLLNLTQMNLDFKFILALKTSKTRVIELTIAEVNIWKRMKFKFHILLILLYLIILWKKDFQNQMPKIVQKTLLKPQTGCKASNRITFTPFRQYLGRIIIFYFLFSNFSIVRSQDFSENLIINGNFSLPIVANRTQYFNRSILGWNCSDICELKNCEKGRKYWLPLHKIDSDCIGQVIDLNSNYKNQVVTQNIDLTAGKYLLHFNYYYPVSSSRNKKLQVSFNNEKILLVNPYVDTTFQVFHFEQSIQAVDGVNLLAFANLGYVGDGTGFKINNVSLYRIIDTPLRYFLELFAEEGRKINTLPGGRVIFRNVLSFLINFDRLELYIYHNRRYSYNSQLLLLSVNNFLNAKSDVAKNILALVNSESIKKQQQFAESANFKGEYITYPSFSPDYEAKSYLDNLNQSFIYFFPLVIILVIVQNIIFRILFHQPISLIFRKFSLWAIFLIMMFDGNIENLTFFTFSEFNTYHSNCFNHKILNTFIFTLFFLLVFTVFGFLHWGKFHYKKNIKLLIDEQSQKQEVIWGIAIDRGIVCFLFGFVHYWLLNLPNVQLFLLTMLEILWIAKKIVFIRKGLYDERYLVYGSIISGGCRVFFQISCFVYESQPNTRIYMNKIIHAHLIYIIIGVSIMQFVIGVLYCLRSFVKICLIKTDNKIVDKYDHQKNLYDIPTKQRSISPQQLNHNLANTQKLKKLSVFSLQRRLNITTVQNAGHLTIEQKDIIIRTKKLHIRKYYK